jgi:hypothetical protein
MGVYASMVMRTIGGKGYCISHVLVMNVSPYSNDNRDGGGKRK